MEEAINVVTRSLREVLTPYEKRQTALQNENFQLRQWVAAIEITECKLQTENSQLRKQLDALHSDVEHLNAVVHGYEDRIQRLLSHKGENISSVAYDLFSPLKLNHSTPLSHSELTSPSEPTTPPLSNNTPQKGSEYPFCATSERTLFAACGTAPTLTDGSNLNPDPLKRSATHQPPPSTLFPPLLNASSPAVLVPSPSNSPISKNTESAPLTSSQGAEILGHPHQATHNTLPLNSPATDSSKASKLVANHTPFSDMMTSSPFSSSHSKLLSPHCALSLSRELCDPLVTKHLQTYVEIVKEEALLRKSLLIVRHAVGLMREYQMGQALRYLHSQGAQKQEWQYISKITQGITIPTGKLRTALGLKSNQFTLEQTMHSLVNRVCSCGAQNECLVCIGKDISSDGALLINAIISKLKFSYEQWRASVFGSVMGEVPSTSTTPKPPQTSPPTPIAALPPTSHVTTPPSSSTSSMSTTAPQSLNHQSSFLNSAAPYFDRVPQQSGTTGSLPPNLADHYGPSRNQPSSRNSAPGKVWNLAGNNSNNNWPSRDSISGTQGRHNSLPSSHRDQNPSSSDSTIRLESGLAMYLRSHPK